MTIPTNPTTLVQEKQDLDLVCSELGLKDIKYLPSPKNTESNIGDLARHATIMLRAYKDHIDGKNDVSVKEIFKEE